MEAKPLLAPQLTQTSDCGYHSQERVKLPISNNCELQRVGLATVNPKGLAASRGQLERVSVAVVFGSAWLMIDEEDFQDTFVFKRDALDLAVANQDTINCGAADQSLRDPGATVAVRYAECLRYLFI